MAYLDEYVRDRASRSLERHDRNLSHWSNSAPPPSPAPVSYKRSLTGQARAAVIQHAAGMLKVFNLSPFQHEGPVRHGLRSGFCSQGRAWAWADYEANEIVQAALRQLGAERPSWYQGQPEYVVPNENCKRCRRPLDDEQIASCKRYCCNACESSSKQYHSSVHGYMERLVTIQTNYRAAKAVVTPKTCAHCNKTFRSLKAGTRYCSKACAGAARENHYQRKTCQNCHTQFLHRTVKNRPGHWCSTACFIEGRAKDLPACTCQECSTEFWPKLPRQKFCCQKCGQKNSLRRRKEALPPRFDARRCDCCNVFFHPDRAAGRFCSKACNIKFYNTRRKAA